MTTLFEEARKFGKSILLWIYFFLGFSAFFFGFGLKQIRILDQNLLLPAPTIYSFASQVFKYLQESLLPPQVEIIVLNPLNAFLTQVIVALSLAFIITFPVLLYKMISFISPALYKKEKVIILKVITFSAILFILGCIFSYLILVPFTFKTLYSFASVLEAFPFFTAYEFVILTFSLIIMVGIMFQIPILMILLTNLGVVKANFWKEKCKYVFLIFLVSSAIVTPDGTGITMLLLFVPLAGLYILGYSLIPKEKKEQEQDSF